MESLVGPERDPERPLSRARLQPGLQNPPASRRRSPSDESARDPRRRGAAHRGPVRDRPLRGRGRRADLQGLRRGRRRPDGDAVAGDPRRPALAGASARSELGFGQLLALIPGVGRSGRRRARDRRHRRGRALTGRARPARGGRGGPRVVSPSRRPRPDALREAAEVAAWDARAGGRGAIARLRWRAP